MIWPWLFLPHSWGFLTCAWGKVNEFISRPHKQISLSHLIASSFLILIHPSISFFSLFFSLLSFREAISKGSKMPLHWPYSLVHGKQTHILHPHRLCLLTMVLLCVLFQGRKPAPFALYISQVEVRNQTTASSNSQDTVEVLHMEVNEAPHILLSYGVGGLRTHEQISYSLQTKSYLSDLPSVLVNGFIHYKSCFLPPFLKYIHPTLEIHFKYLLTL